MDRHGSTDRHPVQADNHATESTLFTCIWSGAHEEEVGLFACAVEEWSRLSDIQREFYKNIREGITGFGLFVNRYVRLISSCGAATEAIPVVLRVVSEPRDSNCWIILKRHDKVVLATSLAEATGELAMTAIDGPFQLFFRRGFLEEQIWKAASILETKFPLLLQSAALCLKATLVMKDERRPIREQGVAKT